MSKDCCHRPVTVLSALLVLFLLWAGPGHSRDKVAAAPVPPPVYGHGDMEPPSDRVFFDTPPAADNRGQVVPFAQDAAPDTPLARDETVDTRGRGAPVPGDGQGAFRWN